MHIPADVSASIGGGLGFEPMTVHAARSKHGAVNHSVTPARLIFGIFLINYKFKEMYLRDF